MKIFNRYLIILLFSIQFYVAGNPQKEEKQGWKSPCEETKNPSSLEDCKGISTEFVHEICCFLKGRQFGESMSECVEVFRDDIRTKELINNTVKNIINGTYWDSDIYDLTYDSIDEFICSSNYILTEKFLIILIFLIFFF